MKSLKQYITEASAVKFFDELDWKIGYIDDYDKDGTHYTRRITINCTPEELKELNEEIWNSPLVQKSPSGIKYKKEDIELKEGDNFTRLSVSNAFDRYIGNKNSQHNTVFKIKFSK